MEGGEIIEDLKTTAIVKIMLNDLTVPMETGVELTKLATAGKEILIELLRDAKRDKETGQFFVPPQALQWYKEVAKIEKDIHELTKGVQEKAMMSKIDITKIVFKELAKKTDNQEELIDLIKKLQKSKDENRSTGESES